MPKLSEEALADLTADIKENGLTDRTVTKLPIPASGNKVYRDSKLKGLGLRITAAGARSFVLSYYTRSGRERRLTLGPFPHELTTVQARAKAAKLKQKIRDGQDPLAEKEAERGAPTVADLCARFREMQFDKLRPATRRNYGAYIANEIEPALKHLKVAEVTHSDISDLHWKISKRAPYVANRVVQLCVRLFSLAVKWKMRPDNPASGVERNREEKRHRYLSGEELARLMAALDAHPDRQAADIIHTLVLTGARKGEVLSMRWRDLDLSKGEWTKPASATKQKAMHHVPLSARAQALLARRHVAAKPGAMFVFPAPGNAPRPGKAGHQVDLERDWEALCKAANITGVRIHDIRHSFASQLLNMGEPLEVIAELLGHSRIQTTQRYAHLDTSVARRATERMGALVENVGKPKVEPTPLRAAR